MVKFQSNFLTFQVYKLVSFSPSERKLQKRQQEEEAELA